LALNRSAHVIKFNFRIEKKTETYETAKEVELREKEFNLKIKSTLKSSAPRLSLAD
jgi:hypothetical protein